MSEIVSAVVTDQRLVALTFDDGPELTYTPMALEALDEASAHATFFVLGSSVNAETRPIVERTQAAGHEVGNHTHTHLSLNGATTELIHEEIARTHFYLEQITGRAPRVIRPPYGHAPEAVNAVAGPMGYRATVLWSAWAVDWENPQAAAEVMLKRVLDGYDLCGGVGPGGIVLMHDGCAPEQAGQSRSETVETVRKLVPALRDKGFRLVTVSELLDARNEA